MSVKMRASTKFEKGAAFAVSQYDHNFTSWYEAKEQPIYRAMVVVDGTQKGHASKQAMVRNEG
eukprot:3119319-Amphidinium_carterae.1